MDNEITTLLQNLVRNNMQGHFVPRAGLLPLLKTLIPAGATVGCGDSVTLVQTGVFDFLRAGPYQFLDKHNPALTKEQKLARQFTPGRVQVVVVDDALGY